MKLLIIIVILFHIISSSTPKAIGRTIKTIAGKGVCDGLPALKASLESPGFIAMNSQGELLIADREHPVFANGTIVTIAGTGLKGYNGDGIDATEAQLYTPNGIAVDSKDLVYFADSNNNRIRKILSNGTIVTIAGRGEPGFQGDGDLAINALLFTPTGIAISPINDDLIFADVVNSRIRLISSATGYISTIAGNGVLDYVKDNVKATKAPLNLPKACAFTPSGSIIISDTLNNRIRMVGLNGMITTIAGTGVAGYNGDGIVATSAQVSSPLSVASNSDGEVYFADSYNHRIRKILSNGKIVTVAGTGSFNYNGDDQLATKTNLNIPSGILIQPNGELLISENNGNVIRKVYTNGTIRSFAGGSSGVGFCNGITAVNSILRSPTGSYFSSNGDILVCLQEGSWIIRISKNGLIESLAGTGKSDFNGDGLLATNTQLNGPNSVAEDLDGQIIVADTYNHVIRKILSNGTMVIIAGTGVSGYNGEGISATRAQLVSPLSVAVSKTGEIFFSDMYRIRKILTNGTIETIIGKSEIGFSEDGTIAKNAKIRNVKSIAINPNTDELYFADSGNYRIRKVSLNGTLVTVGGGGSGLIGFFGENSDALSAKFSSISGIPIDIKGEIYIADSGNHRIRKILTNGTIVTFAGTGESSYFGENVEATKAKLSGPNFASVSPITGDVLISDLGNDFLRIVSYDKCNEILANDPMVCSGNGDCIGTDQCNCSAGYFGLFCDIVECNGVNSNDIGVCNGHGTCQKPNSCNCTSGYIGQNCEIVLCNGLNVTDPMVCSGHGDCKGPNICNCTSDYVGTFCETVHMNGGSNDSTNTTFNNNSTNTTSTNTTSANTTFNNNSTNTTSANTTFKNESSGGNTTFSNSTMPNNNFTLTNSTFMNNETIINNGSSNENFIGNNIQPNISQAFQT